MRIPSQLSEDERIQLVEEWNSGQISDSQLAAKYQLRVTSLRDAIKRWGGRDKTHHRAKSTPSNGESQPTEEPQQVHRHNIEVERLKSQANHYRRLYQEAVKLASTQDVLVDYLKDAVAAMPVVNPQPITVPKGQRPHGLHTVGAILSDIHAGEVVSSDVMMGMGGYDDEVFRQRAGLWVRKFLLLLDIERSANEIPRLVLLLDGDFISGLIHDELNKTNSPSNVMDQTTLVATVMAWAIAQVSAHFEEVHVSCTVGNHGRNQSKIEFKEPYVNWDYICYQIMSLLLRDYSNITWDIPKSLWALTRIENLTFFHYHGHGKIYNSLSIPYYGIERAVREFREIFQVHDLTFDAMAMGHFHHYFERDLGTGPIIINPCWKGGDEFATLGLRKWSKPAQLMFLVHEDRGYVGSRLIHLDGQTEEDAREVPSQIDPLWRDQRV